MTPWGRVAPTASAMVTDREGAEQCRDGYPPRQRVAEITTEVALPAFLRAVRPATGVVALDTFRLGAAARVASIDEILAASRDREDYGRPSGRRSPDTQTR